MTIFNNHVEKLKLPKILIGEKSMTKELSSPLVTKLKLLYTDIKSIDDIITTLNQKINAYRAVLDLDMLLDLNFIEKIAKNGFWAISCNWDISSSCLIYLTNGKLCMKVDKDFYYSFGLTGKKLKTDCWFIEIDLISCLIDEKFRLYLSTRLSKVKGVDLFVGSAEMDLKNSGIDWLDKSITEHLEIMKITETTYFEYPGPELSEEYFFCFTEWVGSLFNQCPYGDQLFQDPFVSICKYPETFTTKRSFKIITVDFGMACAPEILIKSIVGESYMNQELSVVVFTSIDKESKFILQSKSELTIPGRCVGNF